MLQPNPFSSSVAQACNFMLEELGERGGRAGKDGRVARRLVPLIPQRWKLQPCFQRWQQSRRKVSSQNIAQETVYHIYIDLHRTAC